MSDIRVLIADDEPAARRGVQQLLMPYPSFKVVGECRNGYEVLASLDQLRPDVLFLDIQMPEMDGFQLITTRTIERMPATIFLTAYDEFAIRAFEAEAMDYLVKPVTEQRFAATIKRILRQLERINAPRAQTLNVSTARGVVVLPLNDIDWIEAADNYVSVWANGRSYLLREPLRELEMRIGAHGFLRAHRSALVRLGAIRQLSFGDEGEMVAVLASGARVPVSRRRRAAFGAAVRDK